MQTKDFHNLTTVDCSSYKIFFVPRLLPCWHECTKTTVLIIPVERLNTWASILQQTHARSHRVCMFFHYLPPPCTPFHVVLLACVTRCIRIWVAPVSDLSQRYTTFFAFNIWQNSLYSKVLLLQGSYMFSISKFHTVPDPNFQTSQEVLAHLWHLKTNS